MILLAGLALGVAGSGHCASMCGPLLVAFREHSGRMPAGRAVARGVSYHGGRVAM